MLSYLFASDGYLQQVMGCPLGLGSADGFGTTLAEEATHNADRQAA
jgi:hypothetical protein